LLLAILGIVVALFLRIRREFQVQRQKTMQALEQKLSVEQRFLQSQMDLHFVFNALTSIQTFILKNDKENASNHLSNFAKLMRQILVHSKADKILLEDEISTLENFIIIRRLMSPNQFEYAIESNGLMKEEIFIPPMLIQPFIENAIDHGLRPLKNRKGKLVVSFEEDKAANCIICKVDDNGIGIEQSAQLQSKAPEHHGALAIQISKERMSKLNATQTHQFATEGIEVIDKTKIDATQKGTLVIIRIPIV
jgi:sensor histidine kinase YesM